MPHRRAFYPCCNDDIAEPMALLAGLVDEVIFSDLNPNIAQIVAAFGKGVSGPRASFYAGDVRTLVHSLPAIDILFYRRDSDGEGGSRVFILGDSFLPLVLDRFRPQGACIISDGSNSRGGNFRKMCRASGLVKWGWKFTVEPIQPLKETYGLWTIMAKPE